MATVRLSQQELIQRVTKAANSGILACAVHLKNTARKGFGRGGRYTPSAPGTPPNIHRSGLLNSVQAVSTGNLKSTAGSNSPLGIVHERGKHIAARTTRYLPVPLNDAAKRVMETKGTASLRTQGKMTVFRSKAFNLIMVRKEKQRTQSYVTGADGKRRTKVTNAQPVWLLTPTINLPARPWLRPAHAKAKSGYMAAFVTSARRVFRGTAGRVTGGGI